ncbi:hypothetical protein ADK66_10850 [Micromonospora sp. NRRL B-16802]|nr:hypothetical protein ADK66_10850 [Micromonospora sp. NRRL B-16802]
MFGGTSGPMCPASMSYRSYERSLAQFNAALLLVLSPEQRADRRLGRLTGHHGSFGTKVAARPVVLTQPAIK